MKISLTVQIFRTDTIFILSFPKENNSGKMMVLVLCILSYEALYLFQVHENIDDSFKVIEWIRFETNNFKGALFCKKNYIYTKFHENILYGIKVIEWTRFS